MDRSIETKRAQAEPPVARNPIRGFRPFQAEPGMAWGVLSLMWGMAVLAPVTLLMMVLGMFGSPGGADTRDFVVAWVVTWIFALLPAVTGGLAYLPLVCCAAKRWPRAGRAIALACTPIVALGVVPWEMERMLLVWNVGVAVAAGLVFWAATLPLPAAAPAVEGAR